MAKDIYHQQVREALIKDGWTITHDPLALENKAEKMDYEIDLGAEKLIGAERGTEKIAVEVKSFLKASLTHEFHGILGQYIVYEEALEYLESDRILYLAIPDFAFTRIKDYPFLSYLLVKKNVKYLVFDKNQSIILSWKKP